jgi:hypothetical protein
MPKRETAAFLLLAFAALPAAAQNPSQEFSPQLDVYLNEGSRTRLIFRDWLTEGLDQRSSRGTFGTYIETALRPVFRRDLRNRDDVFRLRYLTFRAGYQYSTSFTQGGSAPENRVVAELTARHPLAAGFVFVDRNRGDFRFVNGKPFSTRYRNRLWIERDLKVERFVFTPYIYDEVYFDSRYQALSNNRVAAGIQVPAGPHVVLEPILEDQLNRYGTPRHVQTVQFRVSLFF